MTKHLRWAVGLLAVPLLLGACGGDNDASSPATATAETSTDDTSTPRPAAPIDTPEPPTATSEPTATPQPTSAPSTSEDLTNALLTLSDMPSGWAVDDSSGWAVDDSGVDEDDDDDQSLCEEVNLDHLEGLEAATARALFSMGQLGPFLIQSLTTFEERDDAETVMNGFRQTIEGCREWVEDEDGTIVKWTLREISFPDLGEDSVAFRMSTMTPFGPMKADYVAVRYSPRFGGDAVINMVMLTGFGVMAEIDLEELVRMSDDKARRELNLR